MSQVIPQPAPALPTVDPTAPILDPAAVQHMAEAVDEIVNSPEMKKAMRAVSGEKAPTLAHPQLDVEALLLAIMELKTALSNEHINFTEEAINFNSAKKKELHEQRLQKVQESIDKMNQAKKGGLFGKIFGWITTVALAITGAILVATGAGAVAGGLMLASAGVMAVNQISEETGGWMAKGIAKVFEGFGLSHDSAMLAANLTIAFTVAALGIGAGVTGALGTVAKEVAPMVATITKLAQAIGGFGLIGTGSANIGAAVLQKESLDYRAESMDIQAMINKIVYHLQDDTEHLRQIIDYIQDGARTAVKLIGARQESKQSLIQFVGA